MLVIKDCHAMPDLANYLLANPVIYLSGKPYFPYIDTYINGLIASFAFIVLLKKLDMVHAMYCQPECHVCSNRQSLYFAHLV